MNREESIELLNDGLYDNEEVVNKIYDDFEKEIHDNNNKAQAVVNNQAKKFLEEMKSRTCENCNYNESLNRLRPMCNEIEKENWIATYEKFGNGFGCNKFMRRKL